MRRQKNCVEYGLCLRSFCDFEVYSGCIIVGEKKGRKVLNLNFFKTKKELPTVHKKSFMTLI